jgi:hypothetical protein
MKPLAKIALRVSAGLWILGWFALYLEIFRWHHVNPSLRLSGWARLPDAPLHSRPGGFLVAVLTSSALAPPVFLALLVWMRLWGSNVESPQHKEFAVRSQVALLLTASGIAVSLLGAANYFIHDPRQPIDFDLTMRHGNGGFIVNGVALAALGFFLMRFSVRP